MQRSDLGQGWNQVTDAVLEKHYSLIIDDDTQRYFNEAFRALPRARRQEVVEEIQEALKINPVAAKAVMASFVARHRSEVIAPLSPLADGSCLCFRFSFCSSHLSAVVSECFRERSLLTLLLLWPCSVSCFLLTIVLMCTF